MASASTSSPSVRVLGRRGIGILLRGGGTGEGERTFRGGRVRTSLCFSLVPPSTPPSPHSPFLHQMSSRCLPPSPFPGASSPCCVRWQDDSFPSSRPALTLLCVAPVLATTTAYAGNALYLWGGKGRQREVSVQVSTPFCLLALSPGPDFTSFRATSFTLRSS